MSNNSTLQENEGHNVYSEDAYSDDEFHRFLISAKENFNTLSQQSGYDSFCESNIEENDSEFEKFLESMKKITVSELKPECKNKSIIPYRSDDARPKVFPKGSSEKHEGDVDDDALCFYATSHPILKEFSRKKGHYARQLYQFFNKKVFDNQLPRDMPIIWDGHLRTTAGKTFCSRKNGEFVCSISLSSKILTSVERLHDTLLHEMCHAAVWTINRITGISHGPLWQIWAARCKLILPSINVPQRCHNYEIECRRR